MTRSPPTVSGIFPRKLKRIGMRGRPALRQSLSHLQAVSIVSVARLTAEHNPRVLAKARFPLLTEQSANQKLQYLSFYFRTDDQRANTAYTFAVPEGKDFLEALTSYASMMAHESNNEYDDAFQNYVEKLQTGEVSLPPSMKSQKSAGNDARRELWDVVPEVLVPGKARDEEIELRLRQGQSFLEVASSLQRTVQFIAREANRILGVNEVKELLRQRKRCPWSNDEIQQLIAMRQQSLPPKTLAKWLRRTEPSVKKKLQELRSILSEPDVIEGPQEMPPGLQGSLFNARLAEIWQVIFKSDMTQTWRQALQEKSVEEWLSSISMGISKDVKKVLGGLRPPAWEEIESLSLIDTNDAGVYARLVTSRHEFHMARDRYLYVGSASTYGGGLNSRIVEHTRSTKPRHESRLQSDIRKKNLKGNGRFVTLMVMKMDSSDYEVVLDVRRTVTLAEAILTVW